MIPTLAAGILTCGIFDLHFIPYDPSATSGKTPPPTFRYLPGVCTPEKTDVVIATTGSQHEVLSGMPHPRRILWLIEPEGVFSGTIKYEYPKEADMLRFDLVLTHRKDLLYRLPNAAWMTHAGSWIDPKGARTCDKTRSVSFISSRKTGALDGYAIRHLVAEIVTGYDGFGPLFGAPLPSKEPAIVPYRFHIVIENDPCDWWHTEKLFDAFAGKAVPLYWGGGDEKLRELGFDTSGILRWESPAGLQSLIDEIRKDPAKSYAAFAAAVETNWNRAREIRSAEWLLERVIREAFGLS